MVSLFDDWERGLTADHDNGGYQAGIANALRRGEPAHHGSCLDESQESEHPGSPVENRVGDRRRATDVGGVDSHSVDREPGCDDDQPPRERARGAGRSDPRLRVDLPQLPQTGLLLGFLVVSGGLGCLA